MEEVPRALSSSVAFETEINLEILESSSPVSVDDQDQIDDEILRAIKPTSKEFKKTWGFRKTTIAKREQIGDVDMDASESTQSTPSLRRSGRQPKRTERVEEFLTAVRRNRGRKTNALEESSDRSCPVTDVETASEGSVESTPDVKIDSKIKSEIKKEEDDSSDSDGMTLKEIQNRLRSKRPDTPVTEPSPVQTVPTPQTEGSVRTRSANRAALLQQLATIIKQEPQSHDNTEEEKPVRKASTRIRPEAEIYDPNTLYCICRQPHNNRFMICCDRCEEWFHGDCVGITERRGQLLERDGEDYICPNCTVPQGHDESNTDINQREQAITANVTFLSGANTMSSVEHSMPDQGIKGRIEKATHPTGKKKLKIFHPVEIPNLADLPTEVGETTEVSREVPTAAQAPVSLNVAKCIGPGCSNLALRDSVYCSHDCILKHAAETMKSLSTGKDAKPKEKVKVKTEKSSPPPKSQAPSKPTVVQKAAAEKMDSLKHCVVVIPKIETEGSSDEPSEEYSSSTPSWESDHNYIAVKPEKTAAISSTLFYKCMYHLGILPLAHTHLITHTTTGYITLVHSTLILVSMRFGILVEGQVRKHSHLDPGRVL